MWILLLLTLSRDHFQKGNGTKWSHQTFSLSCTGRHKDVFAACVCPCTRNALLYIIIIWMLIFFFFHCRFCYHLNNSKFQDSHKQKLHKFPLYIIWMLILFLFTIWILRFQTITYSILAQFVVSFMCHSHLQLRLMLPQTYNVRLLQLPFSPGLGFFPFFYSLIT